MKVMTPSISWHNRERISSIDFQPEKWPKDKSGSNSKCRLASAGDDQHVVIWDFQFDDEGKLDLTCLADLSRHQNSVNIVRWSKDGKLLASGDTDSIIIIWHYQDKEIIPDIFGEESAAKNADSSAAAAASENWSIFKTLRGHLQDVVSLDFSPCGNFLISCSTDNTAIIFDLNKGSKVKMLTEHKGWVNGVAWDPLEKFVASIASDRVLRIFKTKTFKNVSKTYKCKMKVDEDVNNEANNDPKTVRLFHDDTFQSFYRRLAFSPDGQLLVVPSGVLDIHGEAKVSNCTYVFSRSDFNKPVLCLPNKEYSVAVRFSPIRYKLRNLRHQTATAITTTTPSNEEGNKTKMQQKVIESSTETEVVQKPWEKVETLFCLPYRLVYAVASQNTVTFYDTQQSEPFARVSKIHYIGLTDLAWSSDGSILTVSSSDGFCSIITFKEGEIGEIFTEETEKQKQQFKKELGENEGKDEKMEVDDETKPVNTIGVKKKGSMETEKKEKLPANPIEVKKKQGNGPASSIEVKKKESSTAKPIEAKKKVATPIEVKKKESSTAKPIEVKKKVATPTEVMPMEVDDANKPVNTIKVKTDDKNTVEVKNKETLYADPIEVKKKLNSEPVNTIEVKKKASSPAKPIEVKKKVANPIEVKRR